MTVLLLLDKTLRKLVVGIHPRIQWLVGFLTCSNCSVTSRSVESYNVLSNPEATVSRTVYAPPITTKPSVAALHNFGYDRTFCLRVVVGASGKHSTERPSQQHRCGNLKKGVIGYVHLKNHGFSKLLRSWGGYVLSNIPIQVESDKRVLTGTGHF